MTKMFLAPLAVTDRLNWLVIISRVISQGFLIVTAYYLVHILHSLVGHLDFASVDDLVVCFVLLSAFGLE